MKYYSIKGYAMPKGQEDKGWQELSNSVQFKLEDNINPYEAINQDLKLVASYWLFIVNEIPKEQIKE